ncbi:MAG TPA: ArgE/DapE family deacylase [Dehalococcoidia bacterium]|nr:ArgE/DapE family deacylase [Dehalococcoidia bacterium]
MTSENSASETLSDLLTRIDSLGDELAELTSRLVRIPTVNPPGDTAALVEAVDAVLRRQGLETRVHEFVSGKASLCATVPGRGEGRLIWLGHIDVVPPGKLDAWERDPFSGEITGGRVYGRGTTDMKGGDAAAIVVAGLLHSLGDRLGPTVEFWFTCDEEVGGADGARKIAEAGLFRADACLIGDGWTGASPTVDIGCKGGMGTTLRARGTAGHASRPMGSDNAIDKLLAVIPYARRIGEFRLELPEELYPVAKASGEDLVANSGLEGADAEMARNLFLYPSVALTMINGGVKTNVIPDEATATFDIRLTPGCDREKVRARMLELVAEAGVQGVEAEVRPSLAGSAGYYESPSHPFVQHMRAAVKAATGTLPALRLLSGGTDGISTHHIAGIPSVGFGAGSAGGGAHGPNEFVKIADLVRAAKVYAAAALTFKPGAAQA